MKKHLFLIVAIVVGVLTFVACDPKDINTPDTPETPDTTDTIEQPTNPTLSDYVGTNWRVDSCHWQGQRTGGTHPYIKVVSENIALFEGRDTVEFTVEDHKITYNDPYIDDLEGSLPITLSIIEAQKDYVHFKSTTGMEFFLARIPDPYGTPVEITEANIQGTWKWEYNYDSDIHDGIEDYYAYTTGVGVDLYTFKADGTLSVSNVITDEINGPMEDMKWAFSNGKIRYSLPQYWDDPEAQDWYEVKFLSNESMVLYMEHNWGEVITTSTEYYTRVK